MAPMPRSSPPGTCAFEVKHRTETMNYGADQQAETRIKAETPEKTVLHFVRRYLTQAIALVLALQQS